MMSAWTADHVGRIEPVSGALIPAVDASDRSGLDAGRHYWDMWPVQDAAGHRTMLAGRQMWMALTAPDRGDPALRHFEAKIHWIERRGSVWRDLGPVLPPLDVPYEREWAGSALLADNALTLFFTAAGTDTRARGYQQELWSATALIGRDGSLGTWSYPTPLIEGYGPYYMAADVHEEGIAWKVR